MTYHVYVSQHATYRYTVRADTFDEANAKVKAHIRDTGTLRAGVVEEEGWEINRTELDDPWPKR